jgi:hypothetical protein
MRKLMAIGLMLCIFTMLVSGASAAPYNSNIHGSVSLSQYANAYATPIVGCPDTPSYASTYLYSKTTTNPHGFTIIGIAQAVAFGGYGTYAEAGQTLSGDLL